jgi:hypothetical protein
MAPLSALTGFVPSHYQKAMSAFNARELDQTDERMLAHPVAASSASARL